MSDTVLSPDPRWQALEKLDFGQLVQTLLLPVVGIVLFLMLWQFSANRIETSLGQFPGPVQVWEQINNLAAEHSRERDKEAAFYERQEERNLKKLEADPDATIKLSLIHI